MPANGQAMTEGLVTMARRRGAWTFSRGATVVVLALGLVACGESASPVDPGTAITPPVPLSPTAGEIPEETFQATATITDEGLDPDRFAGVSGTAFQLAVAGNGKEHTLEIQVSWTSCLTATLSGHSSGKPQAAPQIVNAGASRR